MDVTRWLLGSDPSIRWQVMRDLLDTPDDAVAAERALVSSEGFGTRLLSLQSESERLNNAVYWNDAVYGEDGDRRSVIWSLQSLRRLGADPDSPAVRAAIDRVQEAVVWEEFDNLPFFHGEVEECANGGVLALGAYFGVLGAGSDRILGLLLDQQLADGGWNCDPLEESQHSSFDSTLCVMEGLLEYEQAMAAAAEAETPAAVAALTRVAEARRRGEEYLLERGLFRRRSTGEIVLPRYANFAFPPYWTYDVLRALDYFRAAGDRPDPRIADAIELLRKTRGLDERWPAGTPWNGEVFFALDAPEGEPSPWNTLRALRVLRWYDEGKKDSVSEAGDRLSA